MNRCVLVLSCILASSLASAPAFADLYGGTTVVQWVANGPGLTVQVENSEGEVKTMFAGVQILRASNTSGLSGLPADAYFEGDGLYEAFCIDLYDQIPLSTNLYKMNSLDAAPDPFASLTGGMRDWRARLVAALVTRNTHSTDLGAAAMQAAIWEVVDEENEYLAYDNGSSWDLASGDFFLTAGIGDNDRVAAEANRLLTNLVGLDHNRYVALADGGLFKSAQDYVVVPVPAAVLLGFLGLSAAGLKLRRFA